MSPGRIFLENPDSVEPMTDQLMMWTRMLAMCSKKLATLYGKEGRSWKGDYLDVSMNKPVMEFGGAPKWQMVLRGNLIVKEIPVLDLMVDIATYPSGEVLYFSMFKAIKARTWGELQIETRKECKRFSADYHGPFKVVARVSKQLEMDSLDKDKEKIEAETGVTVGTRYDNLFVDKDKKTWIFFAFVLYEKE